MRWFAWCLMLTSACFIGCEKPEETIPPITPTPTPSGTTDSADHGHEHGEEGHEHEGEGHDQDGEDHKPGEEGSGHDHDEGHAEGEAAEAAAEDEDSAAVTSGEEIRFVANKSLNVPGMMCPVSCWPNVKQTLAGLPGVEGVQLAEQPEGTADGEIQKRVVELRVGASFDSDAAIAALGKINFESSVIN